MTPTPRALPSLIRALLLAPAVALGLPPLEQLETRIELSPAAQLAERAYESTRDSLSASRIGLGVSAFGSVGYGHNHDIIDPQHSWTYNQGMAGGGLSVPVLGSRLQLEDSLSEQQVQLLQLDARHVCARRTATTGRGSGWSCWRAIICRMSPPSGASWSCARARGCCSTPTASSC